MVFRLRLCLGCVVFVACGGGRDTSLMTGTASLSGGEASSTGGVDTAASGSPTGSASSPDSGESSDPSDGSSGQDSASQSAGSSGTDDDDGTSGGSPTSGEDTDSTSGGESTGQGSETGSDTTGLVDGGVLDIVIWAANDCTFVTDPASITVPEGTAFTVNWISHPSSEVEVDVAKIDPFNHVPIIIGMEPGTSYHDEVREWCGDLFTGTFDFRVTSCFDPHYIPVDCGGA